MALTVLASAADRRAGSTGSHAAAAGHVERLYADIVEPGLAESIPASLVTDLIALV